MGRQYKRRESAEREYQNFSISTLEEYVNKVKNETVREKCINYLWNSKINYSKQNEAENLGESRIETSFHRFKAYLQLQIPIRHA